MQRKIIRPPQSGKNQKGASTLAVVLLLLIVLMFPALAVLNRTKSNEQMLSGSVDRAQVFQSAEATLVEAETFASGKPEAPSSGCSAGVCALPSGAAPWQGNPNFWDSSSVRTASSLVSRVQNKYIVEFLGVSTGASDDCTTSGDVSPDAQCDRETWRYRITVRSKTASGAEVILQSNYLVP